MLRPICEVQSPRAISDGSVSLPSSAIFSCPFSSPIASTAPEATPDAGAENFLLPEGVSTMPLTKLIKPLTGMKAGLSLQTFEPSS